MHTKITDAIAECGPGHPAHVTNPRNERIVAIRTGNKPDTFNLSFEDPKVDLRKGKDGDTNYNVPAKIVERTIDVFLTGARVDRFDKWPRFRGLANQKIRLCIVEKLTPTRARISYELPVAGEVQSWRYQTTVGRYSYIGRYSTNNY